MNEEKIRSAFESIHADEALKQRTRAFLRRRTRSCIALKLAAAAACMLCLVFGTSGAYMYFTPTAIISIDVNPSIEMSLNRFDHVIGMEAFNDDGAALVQELDVRYANFAAALSQLLQNENIIQYLAQDEELIIVVTGPDEEQNRQLLTLTQQSTARQQNVYCGSSRFENVEVAHAQGLSHGKYQAGSELMELDAEVTTEDIQQMTMKEIRTAIQSHHGAGHDQSEGHRQNNGGGHGQSQGQHRNDGGNHGSGGRHGRGH